MCCAGLDYEAIRELHQVETFTKVFTFNSSRKSMSTVLPLERGGYRMHTKGASEIVLKKCSFIFKGDGQISPLTKADQNDIVSSVVKPMAGRALRTIALAYKYVYICVYTCTHTHTPAHPWQAELCRP